MGVSKRGSCLILWYVRRCSSGLRSSSNSSRRNFLPEKICASFLISGELISDDMFFALRSASNSFLLRLKSLNTVVLGINVPPFRRFINLAYW